MNYKDSAKRNHPTEQCLYAVLETKIEKYPYAEENDEYMPGFLRVYSESTEIDYNPQRDLQVDAWDNLVREVYLRRGKQPPAQLQPLEKLLGQSVKGPNGEQIWIDGVDNYLYYYGLESDDLYWVQELPAYVAFCTSREKAEELISQSAGQLREPKIQVIPLDQLLTK